MLNGLLLTTYALLLACGGTTVSEPAAVPGGLLLAGVELPSDATIEWLGEGVLIVHNFLTERETQHFVRLATERLDDSTHPPPATEAVAVPSRPRLRTSSRREPH